MKVCASTSRLMLTNAIAKPRKHSSLVVMRLVVCDVGVVQLEVVEVHVRGAFKERARVPCGLQSLWSKVTQFAYTSIYTSIQSDQYMYEHLNYNERHVQTQTQTHGVGNADALANARTHAMWAGGVTQCAAIQANPVWQACAPHTQACAPHTHACTPQTQACAPHTSVCTTHNGMPHRSAACLTSFGHTLRTSNAFYPIIFFVGLTYWRA